MIHTFISFLLIFSIVGSLYEMLTIKHMYLVEINIDTKKIPEYLICYHDNLICRNWLYTITYICITYIDWKVSIFIWLPILIAIPKKINKFLELKTNYYIFTITFNILYVTIFLYEFIKLNPSILTMPINLF